MQWDQANLHLLGFCVVLAAGWETGEAGEPCLLRCGLLGLRLRLAALCISCSVHLLRANASFLASQSVLNSLCLCVF